MNKKLLFCLLFICICVWIYCRCHEYMRITSVYKYGKYEVYRREYRGFGRDYWVEFSSKEDFKSGWIVEGNSTGGIDGLFEGRLLIDSLGITFFEGVGDIQLKKSGDYEVRICEDRRPPLLDSLGIPRSYPPIIVSKDSCIVDYNCYLNHAIRDYNEWKMRNPNSNVYSFKVIDSSKVVVF